MSSTKKFERLPKAIVPSHYDICLKPDLNKFTFQGTITAHLEVSVNESFNGGPIQAYTWNISLKMMPCKVEAFYFELSEFSLSKKFASP